jgi:hypothetical protein
MIITGSYRRGESGDDLADPRLSCLSPLLVAPPGFYR